MFVCINCFERLHHEVLFSISWAGGGGDYGGGSLGAANRGGIILAELTVRFALL